MLVPLSWLKDYVALPANPADLVERLTLAGLESSGVRVVGLPVPAGLTVKAEDATPVWDRDKVVVAKVLKIEKHPDADKLKLVTVDYGAATPKTVVTGAPNIAPGQSGMKVILGLQGTKYFYNDKDGKKTTFTLEPKALRGIMNDAMCMSNFELGIAEDHDGIIILDDSDPAPGTPAQDLLGDIIVELDVLPNMARCLGLLGIAREVAALTGKTVCEPKLDFPTVADKCDSQVTVTIADAKLSGRYIAAIVRNVTVGPAPRWMRTRLQAAGMRPITNIVDITNYVMLETGQPLHAFDYDVLKTRAGGKTPAITVRPAKAGEVLKTLDGTDRKLTPENLVIADTVGAIALAGVMGGLETEVTATTKTILLESAHFDFVSVRKTARQFTLFSEASTRFSRGIHPETAEQAAKRACQLLQQHAGGEVLAGPVDCYPAAQPPMAIDLNRSEIERLLGVALPDGEVERVLTALDFKLESTLWGWSVTPPANRIDIQSGAADLIEDLARVSGYDRLPERLLAQEMPPPVGNRSLELEDGVRDLLVDAGLYECITYSLIDPKFSDASPMRLINAVSPERSVLRTSLLTGLMEVTKRNLETNAGVALFELGPVFLPTKTNLPDEPRRVCIVLSGRRTVVAWDDAVGAAVPVYDFFDMKGIVETLVRNLHVLNVTYQTSKAVPWLHPAKAADVLIDDKVAGSFGEMHPRIAAGYGLAEKSLIVGEFDLEAILAAVPSRFAYKPFSTFPPAKRDVAVIVAGDLPAEKVLAEVKAAGGDLLSEVSLFDVYTGDKVPAGTKSLAFAITYQAPDRTLGDKEIQKAHEKVENRLRHVLKAQIRGKDC
ncbi:phenylalanine--tRNA ligase subunit beta [soil metagenome]